MKRTEEKKINELEYRAKQIIQSKEQSKKI